MLTKIYIVNMTEIFICLCGGKQSCLWHLLLMLNTSYVFYIFRIRPVYIPLKVLYILFLEFKTLYGNCNMYHSQIQVIRQDKCFFVSSTSVTWHLATGTYQATGPTGRKAKILKAGLQLTSMWKAFCSNTVTSSAGLASYSDCVWSLYVCIILYT
jgi:hypothetical protein